jgi:hypothetical protein
VHLSAVKLSPTISSLLSDLPLELGIVSPYHSYPFFLEK